MKMFEKVINARLVKYPEKENIYHQYNTPLDAHDPQLTPLYS